MPDGAIAVSLIESVPRRMCSVCNRIVRAPQLSRSGRCAECRGFHIVGTRGSAHAAIRPSVPYHHDLAAQRFVADHPDGGTLEECGQAFGVTRERVRQIETKALVALRHACRRAGISAGDLAAMLTSRRSGASTEHMSPQPSSAGYVNRTVSESQRHRHAEPLPEEFYSPLGVRLMRALLELEERAAILDELVRRTDAHLAGVDPGPIPAALLVERPTVAPPLEAQEEIEPMPNPPKLWADQSGTSKTLKEWSAELGIPPASIRTRVLKGHWPDGSPKDTAKPARTPKRRKPARPIDLGPLASMPIVAPALDGVALWQLSGISHEVLGRVPRGRLVLLLDAEATAS
jgi:hypothetical protein